MSEEKQEIEIDMIGSYAVISNKGEWVAVFKHQTHAELFSDAFGGSKVEFQIQPITRKIDFPPEQIQAELSKRCAEIEKTHCNSFTEVNTKLFRRGNV